MSYHCIYLALFLQRLIVLMIYACCLLNINTVYGLSNRVLNLGTHRRDVYE